MNFIYFILLLCFVYFFYDILINILNFANFDTVHIKMYLALIILMVSLFILVPAHN
jgi:hypothetical protein